MLENAAVSLSLDVLEVLARRSTRRVALAHVAEASGKFRESLAIRRLADPVHRQVRWLDERGTCEQRDGRLVDVDGHRRRDGGDANVVDASGGNLVARVIRGNHRVFCRRQRGGVSCTPVATARDTRSRRDAAYARFRSTSSSAARAGAGSGASDGSYLMSPMARWPSSGTLTPGLRIPCGSNACLMPANTSRMFAGHTRESSGVRRRPSPCSPLSVPPRLAVSVTTSSSNCSTRARQSGRRT